jgi:hypothetical protein
MLSYTGQKVLEAFYKTLRADDYRLDQKDYHMSGFIGLNFEDQEWLLLDRDEVEEFLKDCQDNYIDVETDFEKLFVERGGKLV